MTLHYHVEQIFYLRNGEEIECSLFERVDPGDERAEVQLFMRLAQRSKSFRLGEAVTFTPEEFYEIATHCWRFGAELAQRIPQSQSDPHA